MRHICTISPSWASLAGRECKRDDNGSVVGLKKVVRDRAGPERQSVQKMSIKSLRFGKVTFAHTGRVVLSRSSMIAFILLLVVEVEKQEVRESWPCLL